MSHCQSDFERIEKGPHVAQIAGTGLDGLRDVNAFPLGTAYIRQATRLNEALLAPDDSNAKQLPHPLPFSLGIGDHRRDWQLELVRRTS